MRKIFYIVSSPPQFLRPSSTFSVQKFCTKFPKIFSGPPNSSYETRRVFTRRELRESTGPHTCVRAADWRRTAGAVPRRSKLSHWVRPAAADTRRRDVISGVGNFGPKKGREHVTAQLSFSRSLHPQSIIGAPSLARIFARVWLRVLQQHAGSSWFELTRDFILTLSWLYR